MKKKSRYVLARLLCTTLTTTGLVVSGATGLDASLFSDPLLATNHQLQPGRPVIDHGAAHVERNGETILDLPAGTYSGAAPDLGAYGRGDTSSCEYWVAPAPSGSDSHPGTFALPWATLDYAAANVLDNSCTVWFKDGLYMGTHDLHERFTSPTTFKAVNPYKAILENNGITVELSGARNMIFEGFEFRHSGPGAAPLVVYMSRADVLWSENITFRNNIFHDSYNNDVLKINDGARFVTIENNVFYNQAANEQHMDVNSVTDITIQDNIFFNDFAGSGRSDAVGTKAFIVIKDSNENTDGLEGSERIVVQRNIFLNWEGAKEPFVQVGNDGKPYHEAEDVRIENNLMIGNAPGVTNTAFAVSGARNVSFANNTVAGDLPSSAYAFRVSIKGLNPQNQNISFYNNIWSDPTGTMGATMTGDSNKFSAGSPAQTSGLVLDNNLYWNGAAPIPPGDLVSPLIHDARRVVGDPLLDADHAAIVLPRWNGSTFLSGNTSIRQEFERLVERYGRIAPGSAAIGRADPAFAPAADILGRPRAATPGLGAYEYYSISLTGSAGPETIWLHWSDPHEPAVASLAITYTMGMTPTLVAGIPTTTRAYTLTNLLPSTVYTITLTARARGGAILSQSNTLMLQTTLRREYCLSLPIVLGSAPL